MDNSSLSTNHTQNLSNFKYGFGNMSDSVSRGISTDVERQGKLVLWGVSEANLYIGCALILAALVTPIAVHLLIGVFERDRIRSLRRRLSRIQSSFRGTYRASDDDREIDTINGEVTGAEIFFGEFRARAATPLGIALGLVIAEGGLASLTLPEQYEGFELRQASFFMSDVACYVSMLWALFAFIDVLVSSLRKSSTVQRSKMQNVFDEVATPLAFIAKLVGAALLFVVVAGLLASAREETFHMFFATVSVSSLGFLAIMASVLQGPAQEVQSAISIIRDDLFRLGDEVEVYDRNHGRARGRAVRVDVRTTTLQGRDGALAVVPNIYVTTGQFINHSRRRFHCVTFTVYLDYRNDPAAVREYLAALRAAAEAHPQRDPARPASATFAAEGGFSPNHMAVAVRLPAPPTADAAAIRDQLVLEALDIGRRLGIRFGAAGLPQDPAPAGPVTFKE